MTNIKSNKIIIHKMQVVMKQEYQKAENKVQTILKNNALSLIQTIITNIPLFLVAIDK